MFDGAQSAPAETGMLKMGVMFELRRPAILGAWTSAQMRN